MVRFIMKFIDIKNLISFGLVLGAFVMGITTPDIPNSEELDIEDTIDDTNTPEPDYGSIEQLSNILDMIHTSRSPREININI